MGASIPAAASQLERDLASIDVKLVASASKAHSPQPLLKQLQDLREDTPGLAVDVTRRKPPLVAAGPPVCWLRG